MSAENSSSGQTTHRKILGEAGEEEMMRSARFTRHGRPRRRDISLGTIQELAAVVDARVDGQEDVPDRKTIIVRAVPRFHNLPNSGEEPSWTTLVANALKRDRRPLNEILGKPSEK